MAPILQQNLQVDISRALGFKNYRGHLVVPQVTTGPFDRFVEQSVLPLFCVSDGLTYDHTRVDLGTLVIVYD